MLGAAAVAELIVFGAGYNPAIRVDEIAREPKVIADIRQRDPSRQYFIAASNEVFAPNLGTTFGVRQVHAYDILNSEDETRQLIPAGYDPRHWELPIEPSAAQLRALGRRGVRFYITPRGLVEIDGALKPPPHRNDAPRGLLAGAALSIAGLVLLLVYSHSIVLGGFDEMS
jgi:hypothetical protein